MKKIIISIVLMALLSTVVTAGSMYDGDWNSYQIFPRNFNINYTKDRNIEGVSVWHLKMRDSSCSIIDKNFTETSCFNKKIVQIRGGWIQHFDERYVNISCLSGNKWKTLYYHSESPRATPCANLIYEEELIGIK